MRLALVATGSRGDCMPLFALAVALRERGHAVRLLTLEEFRAAGERLGLDVRVLPGLSAAFFGGPAGVAMRTSLSRGPRAYLRYFATYMHSFLDGQLRAISQACAGVDAIISWPWLRVAPNVARLLGVPCIIASPTLPLYLRTTAFACPYTRPPDDDGHDIAGSWADAEACFAAGQAAIESWRREVGAPELSLVDELAAQRSLPHLLAISPVLVPKPAEWGAQIELLGSFALPSRASEPPPTELASFIAAGPAPIGIGFSSSVARDSRRLWTIVGEAVARSELRAVIVGGYADVRELATREHVTCVEQVPYEWLLPRLAGLVHHGGLGTTHLCLATGCPAQVLAFGWDQPLWGRRVHELDAGPPPLAEATLSVDALIEALRSLAREPRWREGAGRAGAAMAEDGGAALAARRVEQLLSTPVSSS